MQCIDSSLSTGDIVLFVNMTTGVVVHSDNDYTGLVVGFYGDDWIRADNQNIWSKYRGKPISTKFGDIDIQLSQSNSVDE